MWARIDGHGKVAEVNADKPTAVRTPSGAWMSGTDALEDVDLAEHGWYPITTTDPPEIDPTQEDVPESFYAYDEAAGTVTQGWKVGTLSKAEQKRRAAAGTVGDAIAELASTDHEVADRLEAGEPIPADLASRRKELRRVVAAGS